MARDWVWTADVIRENTKAEAARILKIGVRSVYALASTCRKLGLDVPYSRGHQRMLIEIIPELLAQRRMTTGELITAVHDEYGSVHDRTIFRSVAHLIASGSIVRDGTKQIDSIYRLPTRRRS